MLVTIFFTYGISMDVWEKTGLIQRELEIYKKLASKYNIKFQFLTYGNKNDIDIVKKDKKFTILPVYAKIKKPKSKVLAYFQSLLIPFYFRNELKKSDLFKTNQLWGGWVPLIAKFLLRKKLIVRCGYEYYSFQKKEKKQIILLFFIKIISKIIYNFSDVIVVSSKRDKDTIVRNFRTSSDKIVLSPNWVDCKLFKPISLPKYDKTILSIGRLEDQKNYHLLIKALKNTKFSLDIIGEGKMKNTLKKYAIDNKVKVNFLGKYPNQKMPKLINQYKVYVISSKFEGTPKSLLEAMSCGAVVLGTSVEGIKEIINHNYNGILSGENNFEISKNIKKLFSDNSLTKKLSINARKYILNNHSIEQSISIEKSLYYNLITNK